MKLSTITLYANTPFTDFSNTMNFADNKTRDDFMDKSYQHYTYQASFNFVKDRLNLNVSTSFDDENYTDLTNTKDLEMKFDQSPSWAFLQQVNYCRFTSILDGVTYYAQVVSVEYKNNGTSTLTLVIDGLMTFCQGDISVYAKNVQIDRQHLPEQVFQDNLYFLRTNDDVLNFKTKRYCYQYGVKFTDLVCVIMATVDLSADFGTDNMPEKIKTSKGTIYDKVVSPQNLYLCDYTDFNDLMDKLSDYPWISQNITKVLQIPKIMVDWGNLEKVDMKIDFDKLKTFKNDRISNNLPKFIQFSYEGTMARFGFPIADHPELFRQAYTQIDLTNWQGQSVPLDPANLTPDVGLVIAGQLTIGYANKMVFFPKGYRVDGEESLGDDYGTYIGDYTNSGVWFKDFDEVPVLIDNYKLNLAQNAHQRNLAQNNLISGQVGNIVDNSGKTSLQDRFMSALNVLGSGLSAATIGGKLTDEWQFYRKQQAQFADMGIAKPTLTEATTNNSFNIKNDTFGIFIKMSRIPLDAMYAVLQYHQNYGYQWTGQDDLQPIDSMSHVNYAKFSGNWQINDRKVPQSVMEQIRIQLENGVRFWHNPDKMLYPFNQDVGYFNRRVK